ncbi:hypothetical protein [Nocardioides convexus]|uniref:hypothetical protein n=1 Tax=Nocardioides convexus TaxID=2712224 RepID=UPI002418AAE1|nr:hypothetical protein [Nocardioides convexus]
MLQKLGADLNRVRQQVIQTALRLPGQGDRLRRGGLRLDQRWGRAVVLAGARPVRPQPDPGRPRGQSRPDHRPRRADRARHAGALASYQEQPGADR